MENMNNQSIPHGENGDTSVLTIGELFVNDTSDSNIKKEEKSDKSKEETKEKTTFS